VLGVGIWLLVTEFSVREVSVLVGFNYFEIGTYLMIGAGGTIALLAFCGCCGTMREDRFVLAFVSILVLFVRENILRAGRFTLNSGGVYGTLPFRMAFLRYHPPTSDYPLWPFSFR